MEGPATIGHLIAFGAFMLTCIGALWKFKANAGSVDRLWAKRDKLEDELNKHKVDIAREYVSREELLRITGAMEKHIDSRFDRLEGAINKIQGTAAAAE